MSDRNGDEGYSLVVFAETVGKAKSYAAGTDEFCDYGFTGIRAIRQPMLDKYYKGKPEMDWCKAEDRIALVKECGWFCDHEYLDRERDCPECPAAEWCDDYMDWKEEMK